jgi:hypothetical protein
MEGGLISVNHPVKSDSGWVTPLARRIDLAEVWTGGWDQYARGALAWWLAAGAGIVPVGGSGWTGPGSISPLGSPTTWVLVEDSDVIGGLRRGRTSISARREGPVLLPIGDQLAVLGARGLSLVGWDGEWTRVQEDEQWFPLPSTPTFLRDGERTIAISSGGETGPRENAPVIHPSL